MLVDARGLGCPKPVIMAEEALSKITEGIVTVLVDNEASVNNLKKFASHNALAVEVGTEANYYVVKIVKGFACEVPAKSPVNEQLPVQTHSLNQSFLVVATDTMGKDEALGAVLMKAFFETIKVYKQYPKAIFFMNSGVRLTTTNNEIVEILKELDSAGVEIFSCGTCLKHYNLEAELKIGVRATTSTLIEGLTDSPKPIWIG